MTCSCDKRAKRQSASSLSISMQMHSINSRDHAFPVRLQRTYDVQLRQARQKAEREFLERKRAEQEEKERREREHAEQEAQRRRHAEAEQR